MEHEDTRPLTAQTAKRGMAFLPWSVAGAAVLAAAIFAAQRNEARSGLAGVPEIERRVSELEHKVSELEQKVNDHKIDIDFAESRIQALEDPDRSITLDATHTAFQKVETNNGWFLVSVQNVQPYANGQKLSLQIGNPLSATFVGCKLLVTWGRQFKKGDKYKDWESGLHKEEFTLVNTLQAGHWNSVSITLAPCMPEELAYLVVKIETNVLSLLR